MKKILLFLILISFTVFTACSNQETKETTVSEEETTSEPAPSEESGSGSPVETNSPETDYKPAFPEQTRIKGITTEADYNASEFASGLDSPWGIAALPGGTFAITEKGGTMRILDTEGNLSEEITGFPEVASAGQGGLLDVEASPQFSEDSMLYFTFSEPSDEGTLTALGKGKLSEDQKTIEDFAVIYRALPYYESEGHYGSRIAIDSAGNLFISTGDRMSADNRMRTQELDNGHGKVLHITTEGEPVEGNPFVDTVDAQPEIYSYGHRNVQGLAIHPETGELWASEMGPRGGDELNHIQAGKNYGWPLVSYGVEYSGGAIGEGITEMDDTEQPVYYWDPVLAPSGMTFYSSDEIPEWKNNLFIGGLRAQHIARIVIEEGKVVGEERFLEDAGERFRDLEMGQDGALYAITDGGKVFRIGK